jgi:hypothetical protein
VRRLVGLVVLGGALAGCGTGAPVDERAVEHLLIVSVPGVSWDDVEAGHLPNLAAIADDAAIGLLATRVGRREATLESAYLTIGSGTRAVAPREGPGVALEPGEQYHGEPALDVLQRRLGSTPAGLAYLAIGSARDANERSSFGAEVGTIGDALADAGVARAVVANADLREGRADDGAYGRGAATVVMGSNGLVPAGAVSRSLLVEDTDAPYGVRLDRAAVLEAVDAALVPNRSVVVVESSDLVRASAYARQASPARRAEMRASALREADELIGDVAARAGEDDALLVLSPIAPAGAPDLGVVALQAPSVPEGLLRSATTRRDGYVQLADVGATIAALAAVDVPDSIEGRPFRVAAADASPQDLVRSGVHAAFRDDMVPATVTTFIVVLVALTAATLFRSRLPDAARAAIRLLALGVLGALAATFLSAVLGVDTTVPYVGLLVLGGGVVAMLGHAVDRRRPGLGPMVALGVVVGLLVVDITLGAPLQLNTVFGYSVAVAGRFAGVGNLAFALLASGAVVLAALLAERHGRSGRRAAVATLAVVLVVDALPVLGADVGGLLAMVPAFGLVALVLYDRPIRVTQLVLLGAFSVVALLAVSFVDLARPSDAQTHLARLAEHVLDQRWSTFFDSLNRRWSASFGSGQTGAWVVLLALSATVAISVAVSLLARRGRSSRLRLAPPEAAAATGLVALAALGLVANDSSFAVPFTMLLTVAPVVLHRVATT